MGIVIVSAAKTVEKIIYEVSMLRVAAMLLLIPTRLPSRGKL